MIDGYPSSIDSPEEMLNQIWIIRLVHTQETIISFASINEDEENPELNLFLPHVLVRDGEDYVLEMFCPFIKDQLIPMDMYDVMFVKTNPCDALRDQYRELTSEKYGKLIQELEAIAFDSRVSYISENYQESNAQSFYFEQEEPEKYPN